MQWLLVGLAAILERIVAWFIAKGIKTGAIFLAYVTAILGAYAAIVAATYAAVFALKPVAPSGLTFALAFLPSTTPLFLSAYLTALIAKRAFDWHKYFSRDFTQATLRF